MISWWRVTQSAEQSVPLPCCSSRDSPEREKSSVAAMISEELRAPVLAHDWPMSALRPYAEIQNGPRRDEAIWSQSAASCGHCQNNTNGTNQPRTGWGRCGSGCGINLPSPSKFKTSLTDDYSSSRVIRALARMTSSMPATTRVFARTVSSHPFPRASE